MAQEGLNSLIILGVWTLWKYRNGCVFDKNRPSMEAVLESADQEKDLWVMAGARKLFLLTNPIHGLHIL
jgi:hypothetical protein